MAPAPVFLVRTDLTKADSLASSAELEERTALAIETKTVKKWALYTLSVSTSSRENASDRVSVLVLSPTSSKQHVEIDLQKARVSLYSALDKTLAVTTRGKNITIYYLRAQTTAIAVEWYTKLSELTGRARAKTLQVNVPDLNVTLRVDNPFSAIAHSAEGTLPNNAAEMIIRHCLEMLQRTPEWMDVIKAWKQDELGLAWKHYDRLEWIFGALEENMYGTIAMTRNYDLQLRPKVHYPTSTKVPGGRALEEPAPVDGVLVRLTSQKGQERRFGKMVSKRQYFFSRNQYLLSSKPSFADRTAHGAAEATVSLEADLMLAAKSFIYLCDIKAVRSFTVSTQAPGEDSEEDQEDQEEQEEHQPDEQSTRSATTNANQDAIIELVLKNGLVIRLQAQSKASKNDWMKRLRQLAEYWTARTKADMDLYKSTRDQNLKQLGIDERTEALMGQYAYKWEVSQSYASPTLYNVCGVSQCRTIHVSGTLFRKPRKHTTFERCHVILSQGHLHIFQDTLRKRTGKKLLHIHHDREGTIDLKDCYVYSGLLTENDLLYQNQTFDSNAPGHRALPKIYLEDNWTSTDEDASTTFVIWSSGGNPAVFKARSRAERDHWVLAIQAELGHMV